MNARIRYIVDGVSRFILIVALLLTWQQSAFAQPYNVILFLTDDMDWTDLPFFNRPVEWDDPYDAPSTRDPESWEARIRAPGLNRTWARLYAQEDIVGTNEIYGDIGQYHDSSSPFSIVPADKTVSNPGSDPQVHRYKVGSLTQRAGGGCNKEKDDDDNLIYFKDDLYAANCEPESDILSGFGGLNRLATEGIVFDRFYANSSRCGPTRATIMSGRHTRRVGVIDNNDVLNKGEATIAQILKASCPGGALDDEAGAPACYATGMIGKWHIGKQSPRRPWEKGFDEYIGFVGGGKRPYFSLKPLTCSPPPMIAYCVGSGPTNPTVCPTSGSCTEAQGCSTPGYFCEDTAPAEPCAFNADCDTCDLLKCKISGQACTTDTDCVDIDIECKLGTLYTGRENFAACSDDGTGNTTKTDPFCCKEAGGGDDRGQYAYKEKAGITWRRDKSHGPNVGWACNNDGEVIGREKDPPPQPPEALWTGTGCSYFTRFVRDQAIDFITRHADEADNGANSKPFFLFVSFQTPHDTQTAPERTVQHYRTLDELKPDQPRGRARKHWALIEEVDAAIGRVLKVLDSDGVCGPGSDWDKIGKPCPSPSGCGGTGACHDVSNTMVFFTSDHGRSGSGYGSPVIRAGKNTVWEGGVLVPFLARGPGVATGKILGGDRPASHVDLLPTIADAADMADCGGGLSVNCLDSNRRATLGACSGTGNICKPDPMDDPCDLIGEGICNTLLSDGRSLMPVLAAPDTAEHRDLVYTSYWKDADAIVTRKGYFEDQTGDLGKASRVCGYLGAAASRRCTAGLVGKTCTTDDTECDSSVCDSSSPPANIGNACTTDAECDTRECTDATDKDGNPCSRDADCDEIGGDGVCGFGGDGACAAATGGVCGVKECTAGRIGSPAPPQPATCDMNPDCDTWSCTAPAAKVGVDCTINLDADCDTTTGAKDGVCAPNGDGVCRGALKRIVRGASCVPCGPLADAQGGCGGAQPQECVILGKICAKPKGVPIDPCTDSDLVTACTADDIDDRQRCRSNRDCPPDSDPLLTTCREAGVVACNRCMSASWKLRANLGATPPTPREDGLYDLTSNPEEQDKGFIDELEKSVPLLDCKTFADPAPTIKAVQDDLIGKLQSWSDCTNNSNCDAVECEDAPSCS